MLMVLALKGLRDEKKNYGVGILDYKDSIKRERIASLAHESP